MRLLMILGILIILAVAGLAGFALFGDMDARTRPMSVTVPLAVTGPSVPEPQASPQAGPDDKAQD